MRVDGAPAQAESRSNLTVRFAKRDQGGDLGLAGRKRAKRCAPLVRTRCAWGQQAAARGLSWNEGNVAAVTGMFTGLRRGELLALSWEDVDFEQGVVFVMHATTQLLDADRTLALKDVKTGESGRRAVPLAPMVQSLLLAYRSAHPQAVNRVFFGGRGVRRYDEIWNAKTFSSALRRHLKTLGIEDVTIQRLRHAFNSLGNLAGSNEATRSGMMGHTSTRMTRTQYTTLYKEHASEAVQILESFLRQTRPKQGQEN